MNKKGNRIKFIDAVNFEPVFEPGVKDFYQDPNQNLTSLRVRVAATHAGKITRNNGFYLPHKMREGAASFTAQYPKPIQVHHDTYQDPVGRVVSAKYVDISQGIMDAWDARQVRDDKRPIENDLLRDFCDGKLPAKEAAIVAGKYFIHDESIVDDPDYLGLGYIELVADITDPDAIRKVLDRRYLTGSIGASTDSATCSVCQTNWAGEDGPCEHRPGKVYDGKKCVLIAGTLEYEEYSFVNSPADTHSGVIAVDASGTVSDAIETDDSMGKNEDVALEILDHKQEDQSKEETNMLELKDKKQEDQPAPPTDEVKDKVQTDEDPKATEDKLPVEDSVPPVESGDDSPAKPAEDEVKDEADEADVEDDAQPGNEETDETVEDDADGDDDTQDVQDDAQEDDQVEDDTGDEDVVEDKAEPKDETTDVVEQDEVKDEDQDCTPCSETETKLRERVDALEKEVKFLLEDADVLNSQLADLLQVNRELKLERISDFSKLADAGFHTEEKATELKDAKSDDLDKILNDLAGQVDIVEIADKINSGLSNNPQGTVENPVVTVDKQETEKKSDIKVDRATLEQIKANYYALRFKGQAVADRYLADLQAKGVLPKGGLQIEDKS